MSEFHVEAPLATSRGGLAQSRYVTARTGFEPTIVRTKGDESTNESPRPAIWVCVCVCNDNDEDLDAAAVAIVFMSRAYLDICVGC